MTPQISEAITFFPEGKQEGLQEIEVLKGIWVKPKEDFIKSLIEKRIQLKQHLKEKCDNFSASEQNQLKTNQNILKIIANSTSYGIFIQQDVIHHDKKKEVDVYGLDTFPTKLDKTEKLGTFFNPAMSVFLTAGSRLILATAESLVLENDGHIAYCDTDSIFVSPQHVNLIQEFFQKLNPYNNEGVSMFKIDTEDGKSLENVTFYGLASKRYVLFDYSKDRFTIHKCTLHGLGHLLDVAL